MANSTVSDTDKQLSSLYSKRNDLVAQKEKYDALLTKANSLVSEVAKANNLMLVMIESLKECFSINGKTADSNKIQDASELTSEIVTSLNSQVIPGINQKISQLSSQIASLNSQISNAQKDTTQTI